jgi:hypothetical protein
MALLSLMEVFLFMMKSGFLNAAALVKKSSRKNIIF